MASALFFLDLKGKVLELERPFWYRLANGTLIDESWPDPPRPKL
jgi:hypothetical protein